MSDGFETKPAEQINAVKAVTCFLATVVDHPGFRDEIGNLGREGTDGLRQVLRWMEDQLGAAEQAVIAAQEDRNMAELTRLGLPRAAYADERLRKAWSDGHRAAMNRLEHLDPAIVEAFRQHAFGTPAIDAAAPATPPEG